MNEKDPRVLEFPLPMRTRLRNYQDAGKDPTPQGKDPQPGLVAEEEKVSSRPLYLPLTW